MIRKIQQFLISNKIPSFRLFVVFPIFALLIIVSTVWAQSLDPAAEAGQQIFAERCANCHGPTGEGDGEMSDRLPAPPAKLNDVALLRSAVPVEWFNLISNGDLSAGMPPFGEASSNPLSERQRWQAIAAVYSLGNDETVLAEGRDIFAQECAACHGEAGAGSDEVSTDLSQVGYWGAVSDEMVFARLQDTGAIPEHDFTLDENALWAVVAFARTLGYQNITAVSAPAAELISEATVTGSVRNATTGTAVSGPLTVQLHAFDSAFTRTESMTAQLDENGRFQFDLKDKPADWVYMATLSYEGIEYSSDIARLSSAGAVVDLPIQVYNQINTPDAIEISQLHVSLTFTGGQLQVSELYSFNNNSTAVFVGESGDFNQGTARILLPDNAQNVQFMRGFGGTDNFFPAEEVIQTANGWADTIPMRPGANSLTLLVNYTLPYADGMTIAHAVPYDTGMVLAALPDNGVVFGGDGWQQGTTQMTAAGTATLNYTLGDVPANGVVSFSLSGQPTGGSGNTSWLIGGGVLLAVLAMVGRFVWLRRQPAAVVDEEWDDEDEWDGVDEEEETAVADQHSTPPATDESETLLQAIADLDDAFEAGDIEEVEYQIQRDRLKKKLAAIWQ